MRSLTGARTAVLALALVTGCGSEFGPTGENAPSFAVASHPDSTAHTTFGEPPASLAAAPAIAASPTSLRFLVYAFRPQYNPPSQTLKITNAGGGGLTWTARDNAYWLKFGPISGTAPTSVSVRVDRSAIPIGYNGYRPRYLQAAITVSAVGASNTPLTVPVWLTISYVH
jgi:hypothetical protein